MLGQISRAFHNRDRHVFMRLYKQYFRPHLEFSTQVWLPWSVGDRECLEKDSKKEVNLVTGLRGSDYEEKLGELGMTTLTKRRHRADMAMLHKILREEKRFRLWDLIRKGNWLRTRSTDTTQIP